MRGVLLAVCFVLSACGGGGGGPDPVAPTPTPDVQAAPIPAPQPVAPAVAEPAVQPAPIAQTCTPGPTLDPLQAAARAKLTHWHAGGLAGKKIAWVGDSTTWQLFTSGAIAVGDPDSLPAPAKFVAAVPGTAWLNFGINGASLSAYALSPGTRRGQDALIAAGPDLIVFSYGINDVRQGRTSQATLTDELRTAVTTLRAALPSADIVLRMPNSFLTTDVNGTGYVTPTTSAQAYSDALRGAYRALAGEWPNVAVYDSQALLFEETSQASSPLMLDQIHPSLQGYGQTLAQIMEIITPAPAGQCP